MVLHCPDPCREGMCPGCPQPVTVLKVKTMRNPHLQFVEIELEHGGTIHVNARHLKRTKR